MRRHNAMVALAIASIIGAVGVAWSNNGSTSSDATRVTDEEGVRFLTEYLIARDEGAEKTPPWHRSADELLPNVEYRQSNGQKRGIAELAVVGRVTAVEKGRAFITVGDDPVRGEPVPFDTPHARWLSVEATVEVERSLGGVNAPGRVRFAIPLDRASDFAKAEAGLKGLGRVVLFLYKHPVWDYDPSLYSIYGEHYFATVGDDGTLSFPAMEAARSAELLAPTPRLSDLEDRGRQPRRTIQLRDNGGMEERP